MLLLETCCSWAATLIPVVQKSHMASLSDSMSQVPQKSPPWPVEAWMEC